jgi:hypothetical protein
MKYKIKILKRDGKCYIRLPEQFCADMNLEQCEDVIGKINPKGNLVLSRPLGESDLCQICHKKPHRNTCINCGKLACPSCFWEMGSLCHECVGRGDKK